MQSLRFVFLLAFLYGIEARKARLAGDNGGEKKKSGKGLKPFRGGKGSKPFRSGKGKKRGESEGFFVVDISNTPSSFPSTQPSVPTSMNPSISSVPSNYPSLDPSGTPSDQPSVSSAPSNLPSSKPSISLDPSGTPSVQPSNNPSMNPSVSSVPSNLPSSKPSISLFPSGTPSDQPSVSSKPSISLFPSGTPSDQPSVACPLSGCINNLSDFNTAITTQADNSIIALCRGTTLDIDAQQNITSNDVTLCCEGGGTTCVLKKSGPSFSRMLHVTGESIEMRNMKFYAGSVEGDGANVLIEGEGQHVIRSCTFEGGRAYGSGGNLAVNGGSITITDSSFIYGEAKNGVVEGLSARNGGNLAVSSNSPISSTTITDNMFIGGFAADDGGAVYVTTAGSYNLNGNSGSYNVVEDAAAGCDDVFVNNQCFGVGDNING